MRTFELRGISHIDFQWRQTKDPAERDRLMDEHMRTLQDTMETMHAIGGPMLPDPLVAKKLRD